jgi:hypothetical protein
MATTRKPAGSPSKLDRERGAVMLVVMLILLTATAMGGVALQATQHEVRAAGYNRLAVQTQYVAEAAMSTTLAWIDATSLNGSFYQNQLRVWGTGTHPTPEMWRFGEPEISTTNRAWANRTQWEQQIAYFEPAGGQSGVGTAPLTVPGGAVQGGNFATDAIGTFGPKSAYTPGAERTDIAPATMVDYVVDLYDCQQLPVTASAGSQVNQGGNALQQVQFYCVITARGRSYSAGASTQTWTLPGTTNTYQPSRFQSTHDCRGTVITPPIMIP